MAAVYLVALHGGDLETEDAIAMASAPILQPRSATQPTPAR